MGSESDLIKYFLPVIGTILGTVLGFAGSILMTLINQKSEERKQVRLLTFNAGVENWKEGLKAALTQKRAEVAPIEFYIINSLFLSEVLGKKGINKEKMKEFLIQKYKTMEDLMEVQRELESEKKKDRDKEVTK